jgi:hypothetical protein
MADVLGVRETRMRHRPILTSSARYSVLDTEAAHKLWQIGGAVWIDVLAAPHRAANLPLSALWVPLPHHNIPDSQREWIAQRDGACQDIGSELTQCLLEQTRARRRFLAGEGPNEDLGALRLLPAFHREAAAHYKISIEYSQILRADGANAASFNEESRKSHAGAVRAGRKSFATTSRCETARPKPL